MSSNNRRDSDDRTRDDVERERRDDHVDHMDTDRRDDHVEHVDGDHRDDRTAHADRGYSDDDVDRIDREHDDDRVDRDHDDDRVDHGVNPRERGKWISAAIAVLGLWMVVQAFGLDLNAAQFWNDVLVGALLIGVGGYNYSRRSSEQFGNSAVALIAVAAGLWLLAAPFVLGAEAGATETANELGFFNDVAVGLLAIALGAYSAYRARDHEAETPRTAT